MRDLRKMVVGLGAGVRSKMEILRDVASIAELEAMIDCPGGTWTRAFEQRCNAVSLVLFGITAADTDAPEPHPDNFGEKDRHSWVRFSDADFASYEAALTAWHDWRTVIARYDVEIEQVGCIRYWRSRGYDVSDGAGEALRCFPFFSHQLYAAWKNLLPGARVTLDGSGKRAPQSVEEWGAALAAEAALFRRSE